MAYFVIREKIKAPTSLQVAKGKLEANLKNNPNHKKMVIDAMEKFLSDTGFEKNPPPTYGFEEDVNPDQGDWIT